MKSHHRIEDRDRMDLLEIEDRQEHRDHLGHRELTLARFQKLEMMQI
jgi:hypothetical protein